MIMLKRQDDHQLVNDVLIKGGSTTPTIDTKHHYF